MHKAKGLKQAYEVQDFAYDAIQALRQKVTTSSGQLDIDKDSAAAITAFGRLWVEAQERIRIHRGKPLPGSLKPEPKRKQQHNAPTLQIASDAQAVPAAAAEQPGSEAAA